MAWRTVRQGITAQVIDLVLNEIFKLLCQWANHVFHGYSHFSFIIHTLTSTVLRTFGSTIYAT